MYLLASSDTDVWGVLIAVVALVISVFAFWDARRATKATEVQATTAARTLALSARPIIVGDPKPERPFSYRTTPNDDDNRLKRGDFAFYLSFPLHNVGVGPAIVRRTLIRAGAEDLLIDGENRINGKGFKLELGTNRLVVPVGESALFHCMVPQVSAGAVELRNDIEKNGFEVHVEYGDMAQQQRLLTVIHLFPLYNDIEFRMRRLDLYECTEDWVPNQPPIARTTDDLQME
jgi:hypothetical protein